MVIQHNLAAMNAVEANRKNVTGLKKRTEKLSTGYKINRAADNAAGLGVSEKMRSQINGLSQASCNSNDAISLIQTAEGGLNESEDIAQRMRELAVQASNGTYTDEDRAQMQYEIDALKSEITRIGESTEFNTMKLLDGSCGFGVNINETGNNGIFGVYGARYGTSPGIIDGIEVNDGGGTISTSGDFFNLFGNAISKTGHFEEKLTPADVDNSTSDMAAKYDEGSNKGNPFVSVHMDFGSLPDLKSLEGKHFFTNCCTNCCGRTIEFTDDVGIKQNGSTISVGLKKDDGTYFTDAAEFLNYIVSDNTIKSIPHVEFACKGSTLYLYDVDNNAWSEDNKDKAIFCDDPVDKDPVPPSPPPNQTSYIIANLAGVEIISKNAATPGGENAAWSDDGVTLTLNLIAGKTYDQSSINKIIANATHPKGATNAPANVGMILGNGVFIQEENDWCSGKTIAGERSASPRTDLSPILSPGDYADKIQLIANNYGQYHDLSLQISIDAKPGSEKVDTIDKSNAVLHLATGTEYSESDIERFLMKSGYDYDVILDDDIAYDGCNTVMFDVETPTGITVSTSGGKSVGNDLLIGKSMSCGNPITFQIGANGAEDQKLYVTIDDMRAEALGLDDVFIDPIERALEALGIIDGALTAISTQRSKLGAVQNRLEYTTNSLNNANMNLSSAESQIRDTDMALEMTAYVKDNILQQSSQAMLAQANQMPQSILQMLG
ncbi:MAG: hypothetical protein IJT87_07255 [Ruminiclostridium sp.]|nr:hypothetical protein [Ruminiclostridium sp.]